VLIRIFETEDHFIDEVAFVVTSTHTLVLLPADLPGINKLHANGNSTRQRVPNCSQKVDGRDQIRLLMDVKKSGIFR
jgi:hypothetical protein